MYRRAFGDCVFPLGLCLLLIGQTISTKVFAQVVIRAPLVSQRRFQIWMETHPGSRSLSRALNQRLPDATETARVMALFKAAERDFLNESVAQAREAFVKLTNLSLDGDWRSAQRHIFAYGFMRLAQLTKNRIQRERDLLQVLDFSNAKNLDQKLFPPPLMAELIGLQSRLVLQLIKWKPYNGFQAYRIVIVDGRRFTNTQQLTINLLPGAHRITLLSDVYPPFTQVMDAQIIPDFRLDRDALISGSCHAPQVNLKNLNGFSVKRLTALYPRKCEATIVNGNWESSTNSTSKTLPSSFSAPVVAIESSPPPKPRRSWLTNKWVWIGIGSLIATAVIAFPRNSPPPRTTIMPTHD